MKLQSGFPLLLQQYKALFWKNLLLSWRNKRATFLQLFASFFFFLILFFIENTMEVRFSSSTSNNRSVMDPLPLISPPIPPCEDKNYIKLPCFDFVWSGNQSARITSIVSAIMANNPRRPIPSSKVKSFSTTAEVDEWLNDNPMHCPGALHFWERNATVISYGIQTNSTAIAKRSSYEDPLFKFRIPLQIAAEREIARSLIGVPDFSWVMALKEFAHPAIETFSAMASGGPACFLAIAMFSFVFQISSLVSEKELKLRQGMTMMGLYDSAYWLSWLTFDGILTLLSSLFIVFFGSVFQFELFLNNSFAHLVTVFGFPYDRGISKVYQAVWSFFPPNLLAEALLLLNQATPHNAGVVYNRRISKAKCGADHEECLITLNYIYKWLLGTFFLWIVFAIYLDNVIRNASGVRKPVFYFLKPGYWTGKGGNELEDSGICSCTSSTSAHEEHILPDDEDVQEEEKIVKQQTREEIEDTNVAVQIRGFTKTYPSTIDMTSCGKCKKRSPYHALKGLWLNIVKDQLFCLLGPNGAGKTTTINCLTGIISVTDGDALIYGYSLRSSTGLWNVRKLIGVCPQFDVLWDSLTGQEHLFIFASIKGLNPTSIQSVIEKLLAETGLTEAARVRAVHYSGGMKRRLSVAMALIGDPKLVILDEPTTGMDPITRRHVWDIIEDAKKGRAIVLTTHSMEEADILGDRIGIMVKGMLRCIGTSIRLKSRFGAGFIANVIFTSGANGQNLSSRDEIDRAHCEDVKQLFEQKLDIVPKEEKKSFLTFVIPRDREVLLSNFFAELQDKESELGIADIQLGQTTLEEVFLNIARRAELEPNLKRIDQSGLRYNYRNSTHQWSRMPIQLNDMDHDVNV
ncbi:ABC transporter A family member 2 [Morus notabilis]|uniref:ABC transporter A family member 2 n=1 Tax=Morus notabilis TaxID=981085 RepID=W9QKI0_9ROSA|nr:ABC transporter A family member 2 [Morus notabilis]